MPIRPSEVTINGDRGNEFEQLLGRRTFQVRSPIPVRAAVPGKPDVEVYLLDIDALTLEEFNKLAQYFAAKFGGDLNDVRREMREVGVPILAGDCIPPAMDLRMFV